MNMVKCGEKEFIAKYLEVYPKSYIVNQWIPKVIMEVSRDYVVRDVTSVPYGNDSMKICIMPDGPKVENKLRNLAVVITAGNDVVVRIHKDGVTYNKDKEQECFTLLKQAMSFSCNRLCEAIEKLSDDDINFVREEMDRRTSEIPMDQKNRNAELFMSILRNPDGKEVNSSSEEQGRRTSELSMEQKQRNAKLFMDVLNNHTSKSKNKETALAERFKKEYRNTGKTLNEVIAGMQDGSISDSAMLGIIKSTIGDLTWNE